MKTAKKIAIVYDWLDKWGGVERVLLILHEMFPKAVFFTSTFDRNKANWAKDFRVTTSFMQLFPPFIKGNRILSLPFYPFAFENFNFNGFDLVISVSSSFAKSVMTKPSTRHLCYLLTPTRFLWSHRRDYFEKNILNESYLTSLREWDKVAAARPDSIISISNTVRGRTLKYYRRDSEVLYPPFDMQYWGRLESSLNKEKQKDEFNMKNYFLIVSRLENYKKVDLVIRSFNKRKETLVVVGEGSREKYLKGIAGNNIIFLSRLDDLQLAKLYRGATALIMPQEEDFGYVALEAQFFGCPVIAFGQGGATETVIEGKTGIFFNRQNEKGLTATLETFNKLKYNLGTDTKRLGRQNIKRFDKEIFIRRFKEIL